MTLNKKKLHRAKFKLGVISELGHEHTEEKQTGISTISKPAPVHNPLERDMTVSNFGMSRMNLFDATTVTPDGSQMMGTRKQDVNPAKPSGVVSGQVAPKVSKIAARLDRATTVSELFARGSPTDDHESDSDSDDDFGTSTTETHNAIVMQTMMKPLERDMTVSNFGMSRMNLFDATTVTPDGSQMMGTRKQDVNPAKPSGVVSGQVAPKVSKIAARLDRATTVSELFARGSPTDDHESDSDSDDDFGTSTTETHNAIVMQTMMKPLERDMTVSNFGMSRMNLFDATTVTPDGSQMMGTRKQDVNPAKPSGVVSGQVAPKVSKIAARLDRATTVSELFARGSPTDDHESDSDSDDDFGTSTTETHNAIVMQTMMKPLERDMTVSNFGMSRMNLFDATTVTPDGSQMMGTRKQDVNPAKPSGVVSGQVAPKVSKIAARLDRATTVSELFARGSPTDDHESDSDSDDDFGTSTTETHNAIVMQTMMKPLERDMTVSNFGMSRMNLFDATTVTPDGSQMMGTRKQDVNPAKPSGVVSGQVAPKVSKIAARLDRATTVSELFARGSPTDDHESDSDSDDDFGTSTTETHNAIVMQTMMKPLERDMTVSNFGMSRMNLFDATTVTPDGSQMMGTRKQDVNPAKPSGIVSGQVAPKVSKIAARLDRATTVSELFARGSPTDDPGSDSDSDDDFGTSTTETHNAIVMQTMMKPLERDMTVSNFGMSRMNLFDATTVTPDGSQMMGTRKQDVNPAKPSGIVSSQVAPKVSKIAARLDRATTVSELFARGSPTDDPGSDSDSDSDDDFGTSTVAPMCEIVTKESEVINQVRTEPVICTQEKSAWRYGCSNTDTKGDKDDTTEVIGYANDPVSSNELDEVHVRDTSNYTMEYLGSDDLVSLNRGGWAYKEAFHPTHKALKSPPRKSKESSNRSGFQKVQAHADLIVGLPALSSPVLGSRCKTSSIRLASSSSHKFDEPSKGLTDEEVSWAAEQFGIDFSTKQDMTFGNTSALWQSIRDRGTRAGVHVEPLVPVVNISFATPVPPGVQPRTRQNRPRQTHRKVTKMGQSS